MKKILNRIRGPLAGLLIAVSTVSSIAGMLPSGQPGVYLIAPCEPVKALHARIAKNNPTSDTFGWYHNENLIATQFVKDQLQSRYGFGTHPALMYGIATFPKQRSATLYVGHGLKGCYTHAYQIDFDLAHRKMDEIKGREV